MPTITTRRKNPTLLDVLAWLQPQDRLLIRLLSEHELLTTFQIHTLLFTNLRVCQRRLARLRQLRLLHGFRHPDPDHGRSGPARWTLGPLGLRLVAAETGQPFPTPRTVQQRLERVAGSTQQAHRLGTNQFFIDLITHTRIRPGSRLVRWWPQQRTTGMLPSVVPDGHGIWHAHGRTVAWFLEYDTGAMSLPRLIAKLGAYDKALRQGRPGWPLLLWLHSPTREHHLHQAIGQHIPLRPVATAARHLGTPGPAGAVWRLVGGHGRLQLHQLGGHIDDPGGDWRQPEHDHPPL